MLILERLRQLATGASRATIALPEIAKAAEILTALAGRFRVSPLPKKSTDESNSLFRNRATSKHQTVDNNSFIGYSSDLELTRRR